MTGRREGGQGQFFYSFGLDKVGATRPSGSPDRRCPRSWLGAQRARTSLLANGPAFDRPCADDPDADCRLRICDPLRAAAVCRGPGQSGLLVVLQAWPRKTRFPIIRCSAARGTSAFVRAMQKHSRPMLTPSLNRLVDYINWKHIGQTGIFLKKDARSPCLLADGGVNADIAVATSNAVPARSQPGSGSHHH